MLAARDTFSSSMRPVIGPQYTDDLVPLRRPHFARRNHQLFFLLSSRAHADLDSGDETLWEQIDGVSTVGQLRASVPQLDVRLRRLWDLGACELAPSSFPAHRRRILVVEPHMDDAVLSVGALMWSMRETCEFTVVTAAGHSNYTSYFDLDREYFDVSRVSALRAAESALVMRLLGGSHSTLGLLEAPLRFQAGNWTLDWYRRNRKLVDAFIMHAATDREIESWAAAIERLLCSANADEVWLPLGVGSHVDHELVRNACLRALSRLEGLERRTALFFYQDVPYANEFDGHTAAVVGAIVEAGGVVEVLREDIGQWLGDKLRLASIFGSQFKPSYMAPRIEEAARRATSTPVGRAELRVRVTRAPGPVEPLAAYSGRARVEAVAARLDGWYGRHRSDRRIRILSPVPIARWEEDMALLLEAFPRCAFELHVSEEYAVETSRLVDPLIQVHIVAGREAAWLARLLRLVIAHPEPTIVLSGEGLQRLAPLARAALFRSDVLVATRMNDLALALRSVIGHG